MSKARDLANAGTALTTVSATELGYLDGVTSAVQTQIDSKEPTLPSQTGNSGKYLTTNGSAKSWGTVSQYALPSQTGNAGKFLTTNGTAESWGTVSQPITWTQKANTLGAGDFLDIASNGSTIYVAVGQAGALWSSTDSGATWASRTSGFGANDILSVAFGAGIFVAVGQAGLISTSTDGITWTARTAGVAANALNNVEFLNSNFIAVGDGASGGTGGITTSTDGITWTKRTTPASTSTSLVSVTYGNGYYVATGTFSTTAGVYSTNLTTWTGLPTSLSTGIHFIDYQNSQFIGFTQASTTLWYNGNNPTATWNGLSQAQPYLSMRNSTLATQIAVYNNKYYYVTSGGTYIGSYIYSTSTAFSTSNYGFSEHYQPIPIPAIPISATDVRRATTIFVNSTGGIIVGEAQGRLHQSF